MQPSDDAAWISAAIDQLESHELVYHHHEALHLIDEATATRLAGEFSGWGDVDAFCRYISGPAWRERQLRDDLVVSWARSPDRWWRRAALVSTVPLNLRAAGGTGDTDRTLMICRHLVNDRDDTVVKALSWALRELVLWNPVAVREFIEQHQNVVAARVRREVTSKLETGLKNPR